MQYLPAIILGLLVLVIITRPFTVLLHELGHAIPAMLLTKEGATVYIGSYGDKSQSFRIPIGGLEIWFRYNPIKWHGGVCIPKAEDISLDKIAIYTICGPLFSFFIAACFFYLTLSYDLHGSVKLICAFAFGSTILDLIFNLIPQKMTMADGTQLLSDGYTLFNLRTYKRFPDEYANAVESYSKEEYEKTAKIFEDFISRGLVNEDVYRYASTSYLYIQNYEKAYKIQKEFEIRYELNSDDYYNLGLTCSMLNLKEDKMRYFKKSLELNPENLHSLNNMGYELNKKDKYQEAILLFDKAIEIQSDFAYAYNNRGHAKIEIGQFDDGLKDLKYSLQLNSENSYVYRNLGIYHLKNNEKSEALKYFLQSKQIDKNTDLIDEFINQARV